MALLLILSLIGLGVAAAEGMVRMPRLEDGTGDDGAVGGDASVATACSLDVELMLRSFGCVMSSAEEGGESLGLLCVGELLAEESNMMTSAAAAIDERGIGCVGAVTMGVWGSGCEGSTICGMETGCGGGGGWGGCSVAEVGPKLAARAPKSKIYNVI